jgi:hypothetical protein
VSVTPLRLLLLVALLLLAGCEREGAPGPGDAAEAPAAVPDDGAPDPRPVVLTRADLGPLLGTVPGDVVAFAFHHGRFAPVPVQVDERFAYDVAAGYADLRPEDCVNPDWCRDLAGHLVLPGYADPGTLVGPDPDAALDADDEVALMLADFGEAASGHPAGVDAATGVVVAATASGRTRHAYLYRRTDPALDPAAGAAYVRYAPTFVRGPYLETYRRGGHRADGPHGDGPRATANPESTTVRTDFYALGFSDRWVLDRLEVEGGPDLLDVDLLSFGPGRCERTPYTGSRAEGAFLVNRSGPVRALRRVIGFNSGPLTEMTWTFYRRHAVSDAVLRVHPVPGVALWLDHTPEATGATYRDPERPDGAAVDGRPDAGEGDGRAPARWQVFDGPRSRYVMDYAVSTAGNARAAVRAVFFDDARSEVPTCTADEAFYGAHGVWVDGRIPNSDPRLGRVEGRLSVRRRFVFGGDPETARRALAEAVRVSARPVR